MNRGERLSILTLLWLAVFCGSSSGKSASLEITVKVAAQSRDCFFIPNIKAGYNLYIEAEVTKSTGAVGNVDIILTVLTPRNEILFTSNRTDSAEFDQDIQVEGDYQFCLENSYSPFSAKFVAMSVYTSDPEYDYYEDDIDYEEMNRMKGMNEDDVSDLDLSIDEIHQSLHYIRTNMRRASLSVASLISSYTQDLHMAENNADKITFWSAVHLAVLVTISIVQVNMVKNLFSDKSFVYGLLNRLQY